MILFTVINASGYITRNNMAFALSYGLYIFGFVIFGLEFLQEEEKRRDSIKKILQATKDQKLTFNLKENDSTHDQYCLRRLKKYA